MPAFFLLLVPALVAGGGFEATTFVGRQVCVSCHDADRAAHVCTAEGGTGHAKSYRALLRPEAASIAYVTGTGTPPRESQLCLGCHATAAEEGPRWWDPTFRIEDGVQCETCHGPGSDHARAMRTAPGRKGEPPPFDESKLAISPKVDLCKSCHVPRPSHHLVLDSGYRRPEDDARYKNPVGLAVSPAGERLFVVCERSGSVAVVDTAGRRVLSEIPVDPLPHDVAVHPDGRTLYVTSRRSNTVSAIDVASGKVTATAKVGALPHGVSTDAAGERLFVLETGQNAISVLDSHTLAETARLAAGTGPWAAVLRPDGKALYVTNLMPEPAPFRDPHHSEITIVDPREGRVTARVPVPDANTIQGIAFVPGRDVVLFTLMRTNDLVPMTRLQQGWVVTNGLGVLWPDGRVDQVLLDDPADSFPDPTGLAVSGDGKFAIVTSAGSDRVAVVDVAALLTFLRNTPDERRLNDLPYRLGTSARFLVKRIPVGRNPRSVAFSPDGRFAYVAATLDDAITVIETSGFTVAGTIPLGGTEVVTETRRGERRFNSAAFAFGRQFSCRSCHPEGHLNGLTLDIEADGIGLRPVDIRSLRGIFDTPPFKWEGTNPSLAHQCGPRLSVFFNRIDPPSREELSDLVRYVATIEQLPNPYRSADGLTPAQRRGKQIYERKTNNRGDPMPPVTRCVYCHSGSYKTSLQATGVGTEMWFDSEAPDVDRIDLNDVDTLGWFGIVYFAYLSPDPSRLRALDNPHLRGGWNSAPYLHNGTAPTLEEIWTRFNLYDWHGVTGDLTRQQFNDLIEYLKTL